MHTIRERQHCTVCLALFICPLIVSQRMWHTDYAHCKIVQITFSFDFGIHTGRTDNRTSLLGSSLHLIMLENEQYKRYAIISSSFFLLRFFFFHSVKWVVSFPFWLFCLIQFRVEQLKHEQLEWRSQENGPTATTRLSTLVYWTNENFKALCLNFNFNRSQFPVTVHIIKIPEWQSPWIPLWHTIFSKLEIILSPKCATLKKNNLTLFRFELMFHSSQILIVKNKQKMWNMRYCKCIEIITWNAYMNYDCKYFIVKNAQWTWWIANDFEIV